MLVISVLMTDTQTIKGCEPQGGIEVIPAIFLELFWRISANGEIGRAFSRTSGWKSAVPELKFAKTKREKIAGRTFIPPHGSHPFIVCVSVIRTEITNIFGPKDSRQDTTLLACATMLLSNERNYCHTSEESQRTLERSRTLGF